MDKKVLIIAIAVFLLTGGAASFFAVKDKNADQNNTKENTPNVTDSRDEKNSVSDSQSSTNTAQQEETTLTISKTSTSAPINLNIDGNNMEGYMKSLESGVAHLKSTALPGENGNTVIFGHSSYYKNKPGNYKTVFAKLNNLAVGDEIKINYKSKDLIYKVTEKRIVKPEDTSVVNQDKTQKILTLITCWPVGTTNERLVIRADLY